MTELRLIEKETMQRIVPLLHRRNPALSPELLSERVAEMVVQGFQCLGAFEDDTLVAIAGFWIKTRYHTGKVIEPDGVFVEAPYRSQGIGAQMLAWIYQFAEQQGCLESELHCYTSNAAAHRFWMNQGYRIIAFHFAKDLHQ